MKSIDLLKPILEGGVRSTNFFNGRLLSSDDLIREQAANRAWLGRLGRLVGSGVAWGLNVAPSRTPGKPAVLVNPGLAVNALGQTLQLAEPVEVSLLHPEDTIEPEVVVRISDFADCAPSETGIYLTGRGVYLLTLAPAGAVEGRVPANGLGNTAASCASRSLVDAVKFRLLSLAEFFSSEEMLSPKLRNIIAARCFGIAGSSTFVTDPFGPPEKASKLLEKLKKLRDREVPLAVLHWKAAGGVEFIDHWCVRRRLAGPPDERVWSPAIGEGALADGEAMLLQFQEQVAALAATNAPESAVVTEIFDYLPPVGVLPLARSPRFRGFAVDRFFKGIKARDPIYIEGARVAPLLRRAAQFPPIDVASGEMLWVYHVRENAMKADGLSGARVQPYALFVSGQVPFDGAATFDVGHWDYASFG